MLNNFLVGGLESSACFVFRICISWLGRGKISLPSYKTNQVGASGPYNLSENYDYIDGHQKVSAHMTDG